MAYEYTEVSVSKSQEAIRKLIMSHKGFGIAIVSERDPNHMLPSQEGFQAKVLIDEKPYTIKIMAILKSVKDNKQEQEERRIWRVLYHHLKSVFEASDSGVMEFRELMLPYVVTADGRTISEHILPRLDSALADKPERLLNEGNSSCR